MGEGIAYAMVCRAFKRNGISVNVDSTSIITIDIANKLYNVWSKNTDVISITSIDALIAEVKQRLTES